MIVFGIICLVLLTIVELSCVYSIGKATVTNGFAKLLAFITINIFIVPLIIFIAMNLK